MDARNPNQVLMFIQPGLLPAEESTPSPFFKVLENDANR